MTVLIPYYAKEHALVSQLSTLLGVRQDDLVNRVDSIMSKLKESEKELEALRQAQLLSKVDDILSTATRNNDGILLYNIMPESFKY